RREGPPHDEAHALVGNRAAGDLRREREELLVEQALGVERGDERRAALDEDRLPRALAQHRAEHGARADRAAALHRSDTQSFGYALLAKLLLALGRRDDERAHLARGEERQPQIELAAAAHHRVERRPALAERRAERAVIGGVLRKDVLRRPKVPAI